MEGSGGILEITSFPDAIDHFEFNGYGTSVNTNEAVLRYFETNKEKTYFALLTKAKEVADGSTSGSATILYGKMEKDGLIKAKTVDVLYNAFETECNDGANLPFFIKDKYLITNP